MLWLDHHTIGFQRDCLLCNRNNDMNPSLDCSLHSDYNARLYLGFQTHSAIAKPSLFFAYLQRGLGFWSLRFYCFCEVLSVIPLWCKLHMDNTRGRMQSQRRTSNLFFGQSSSSASSSYQVTAQESEAEGGRLPSPNANTGNSQRLLEGRLLERNDAETPSTGPVTLEPAFQSAISDANPQQQETPSTGPVTLEPAVQSSISDANPQQQEFDVAYEDSNGNIRWSVVMNPNLEGIAESFDRNTRRRITPTNEQNVGGRLESGSDNVRASSPVLPHAQPLADTHARAGLVQQALEILQLVENNVLQFVHAIGVEVHVPEGMHFDVEGMTYEEVLALQEQIGSVSTGLTEDAILTGTSRRMYQFMKLGPPVEEDPCIVCQEDYFDGEELAKLDCGHEYHFSCIKQWLMLNNTCPMCKAAAVTFCTCHRS